MCHFKINFGRPQNKKQITDTHLYAQWHGSYLREVVHKHELNIEHHGLYLDLQSSLLP